LTASGYKNHGMNECALTEVRRDRQGDEECHRLLKVSRHAAAVEGEIAAV
jgi:hypothetical protein